MSREERKGRVRCRETIESQGHGVKSVYLQL
jgi:hypothetical protein